MKKDLKDRLSKLDKLRTQLKKEEKSASTEIMEMLKQLMVDNYPMLVAIRWQQYIPGYNDGEPCEFDMYGPEFRFADNLMNNDNQSSDEDEDSEEIEFIDDADAQELVKKQTDILNHRDMEKLRKAVKDVIKVWNCLSDMEDVVREMFDDNVQITVTKDGVETEDYDCGY